MDLLCITPVKHLKGVYELMESYGKVDYHPDIKKDQLIGLLKGKKYDALFTNPNKQGMKLDKEVLAHANFRVLNTCSTGTNHIDLAYCQEKGIEVWSLAKDYELINELPSTSELALGLMIGLLRKINPAFSSVQRYEWDYTPYVGRQIRGLNVGVVGFGRLGKIFCRQLEGLMANIFVHDPYAKAEGYRQVSLQELLQNCDVVALHTHVTEETRKFMNKERISWMKDQSYLINTARGELVDENAVLDALKTGKLAGYGTDVLDHEFSDIKESQLIRHAKDYNILITPHVGGMTIEGQTKAFSFAINKFSKL